MFYTLYLNPTIDKTVYFHTFIMGQTNRPYRIVEDGAGKAINAAVVLGEMGEAVACIGLLSVTDGQIIQNRLEDNGIPYAFFENDRRARVNIKIFDESKKNVTEINEPGAPATREELKMVSEKLIATAKNKDSVFLTGSLPTGCGDSFYADLIVALKKKGVRCILDAAGDPLRLGIQAQPYFIKPNKEEICGLLGLDDPDFMEIARAAKKISDEGVSYVMVSLGREGAMIAGEGKVLFAKALSADVKSTVGAGDSMLAAAACRLDKNMQTALKSGVAAATASVMQEGTRLMKKSDYDRFLEQVKVEKIL